MEKEIVLERLKENLDLMVKRKTEKFGAEYPWRKYRSIDISDSYELGFIHATAGAIQMLEGDFDPHWARTDQQRDPILSATVENS